MAMESPAWDLLTADAAITALVPIARIRKGFAGESPPLPYIVLEQGANPLNYVAGRPGMDVFRTTVKVVAADTKQCNAIAELVRDALELAAVGIFADGPTFEADTKVYLHMSDWRFHTAR